MRQIIFIGLILIFSILNAETRKYDVLLGDKVVGSVVATKSVSGTKITYKTDFKIKIKVFKTYNIRSISTVVYDNGKMTDGHMIVYKDDKLDEEIRVLKDGNKYVHSNVDPKEDVTTNQILTDVTKIYFKEPKGTDIFTARFLDFGKMTKQTDGSYKFKLPNGDENKYYFKNGKLDKIIANRTLYKLTFQYKPGS